MLNFHMMNQRRRGLAFFAPAQTPSDRHCGARVEMIALGMDMLPEPALLLWVPIVSYLVYELGDRILTVFYLIYNITEFQHKIAHSLFVPN